jgi:hypothetical protein
MSKRKTFTKLTEKLDDVIGALGKVTEAIALSQSEKKQKPDLPNTVVRVELDVLKQAQKLVFVTDKRSPEGRARIEEYLAMVMPLTEVGPVYQKAMAKKAAETYQNALHPPPRAALHPPVLVQKSEPIRPTVVAAVPAPKTLSI